jgi:hypothetical protein
MTIAMQPIYTQTVGSGGAASVIFNNIPQTFTDLKVVFSLRSTATGSLTGGMIDSSYVAFNGSNTNTSWTFLFGFNNAATSSRGSSPTIMYLGPINGAGSTTSTFSNSEIYTPNYVSNNFKSSIVDNIAENNSSSGYFVSSLALLNRNTTAITSLGIYAGEGNWAQHSTVSLYGITKG